MWVINPLATTLARRAEGSFQSHESVPFWLSLPCEHTALSPSLAIVCLCRPCGKRTVLASDHDPSLRRKRTVACV